MSIMIRVLSVAALSMVIASLPAVALAQVDQEVLARTILGDDAYAAQVAVGRVQAVMESEGIGPELRAALVTVLERQNEVYFNYKKVFASGVLDGIDDPADYPPEMGEFWGEGYFHLFMTVIALRDPQAIPALVGALGEGPRVAEALAELGEEAAPALLSVAEGGAREEIQAAGAMRALTLLVKDPKAQPISQSILERTRRLAREQLSEKTEYPDVNYHSPSGQSYRLQGAVTLALALEDPFLRELVSDLARDPAAVRRLGVEDSGVLAGVQRHAAEALARPPRRR